MWWEQKFSVFLDDQHVGDAAETVVGQLEDGRIDDCEQRFLKKNSKG